MSKNKVENLHPEYRKLQKFIDSKISCTYLDGVSGFGGTWRFSDDSTITLIPPHERNRRPSLIRSNTEYHIKSFLKNSGITLSLDEGKLLEKLKKYMENEYNDYGY